MHSNTAEYYDPLRLASLIKTVKKCEVKSEKRELIFTILY